MLVFSFLFFFSWSSLDCLNIYCRLCCQIQGKGIDDCHIQRELYKLSQNRKFLRCIRDHPLSTFCLKDSNNSFLEQPPCNWSSGLSNHPVRNSSPRGCRDWCGEGSVLRAAHLPTGDAFSVYQTSRRCVFIAIYFWEIFLPWLLLWPLHHAVMRRFISGFVCCWF